MLPVTVSADMSGSLGYGLICITTDELLFKTDNEDRIFAIEIRVLFTQPIASF